MKLLNKIVFYLLIGSITVSTLQSCGSKYKLQDQTPLNTKRVYFQEWFAGVKVGGTGINMYFPNLNNTNSIEIDSVFFRNLKGKLEKGRAKYTAILKHKTAHELAEIANKKSKFPFKLTNNECVISYIEQGEKKYLKVSNIAENEGVYYEKGHPYALK
ncbi:hypothetical protein [Lacinutrix salivirga]